MRERMGVLSRPEEVAALVRLKVAAGWIRHQIPPKEHWAFTYDMLQRVSRSFTLVIQQLGPDLRNVVCVFYLVLRALDTVEDDTGIPNEVKLPILRDFYRHIYNPDWLFSCGANDYSVLMDNFRQVSTAFLELGEGTTEEGMLPFCLFPTLTMVGQRVRHVVDLTMVVQRVRHVVHLIWSANEFGILFMAGASKACKILYCYGRSL